MQASDPYKISALVLAAGLSSRMGSTNKMLMPVEGKPMLLGVVEGLIASTADEVIVVLGQEHEKVNTIVPSHQKVSIILNENYQLGMSTSIKVGVKQLMDPSDGCMICLGDMPYLTTDDYNQMLEHARLNMRPDSIIRPLFEQKAGHPVFFSKSYFPALITLPDYDQGAQSLLRDQTSSIQYLQALDNRFLLDIDK